MSLFFSTLSVEEAVIAARTLARPMSPEDIPLASAYGRILAADIRADIDIPGFNRSSVDGYAVRSRDTAGASESLPALLSLTGRVAMGEAGYRKLPADSCLYVPTGGAVPEEADAVVMVEYTESIGQDILVKKPVAPGENVVLRGEDFSAGEVVLSRGTLLSARAIAALAAAGQTTVPVTRRPRIRGDIDWKRADPGWRYPGGKPGQGYQQSGCAGLFSHRPDVSPSITALPGTTATGSVKS